MKKIMWQNYSVNLWQNFCVSLSINPLKLNKMEQKKSSQANLEKQRSTFFQIGLVISLVLVLLAFECTRSTGELSTLFDYTTFEPEEEFNKVVRIKEKPEPKIEKKKNFIIKEILPNDALLKKEPEAFDSEGGEDIPIEPMPIEDEKINVDEIFIIVEEMPEFPGGDNALLNFLNKNAIYPEAAAEINIEGTVYVYFVVNKKGFVEDVQILRGVDPLLNKAAIDVVRKLPKWKPGLQRGKAVKVAFRVPIKFRLN